MSGECNRCGEHAVECRCNAMTPSPDTLPEEPMRKQFEALRDFPADGRPDGTADPETMTWLILNGYIELHEQMKACSCCGTPKLDYSFFRITNAGRLFCDQFATIERLTAENKALREDNKRMADVLRAIYAGTGHLTDDDWEAIGAALSNTDAQA